MYFWLKYYKQKIKEAQKGQVIVLTALLLPLFFAIVGLVTDLGKMYIVHTNLQHAMDAAALELGHKIYNKSIAWEEAEIESKLSGAIKSNFAENLKNTDAIMTGDDTSDRYLQINAATVVTPISWKFFFNESVDVGATAKVFIPGDTEDDVTSDFTNNFEGIVYTSAATYGHGKEIKPLPKEYSTHMGMGDSGLAKYTKQLTSQNNNVQKDFTTNLSLPLADNTNYSYTSNASKTINVNISEGYANGKAEEKPIYIVVNNKDAELNIDVTAKMDKKFPIIIIYNGQKNINLNLKPGSEFHGIVSASSMSNGKLTIKNENKDSDSGIVYHGFVAVKNLHLDCEWNGKWMDNGFSVPDIWGDTDVDFKPSNSSGNIHLVGPS